VNRIIQRVKHAGATFLGFKLFFCEESAVIVGHKCTFEGRMPDNSRLQKVVNWPICRDLTEVRGFLGTLGTIQIFIKDFAVHAKPLVQLTRKNVDFEFGETQLQAMETLKMLAKDSEAIQAIDYNSPNEVVLAVDSSWMAVRFVLSQIGDDGKRYPSRYRSITWNEREQNYSQAKIKLYGLFRALKAIKVFIIGIKNLVVEVDAKYIKGMINNPDIQPNTTINCWIAGILLFDFKLRHVSSKDHAPADSLSRRLRAEEDPEETNDVDDWIDQVYSFGIETMNRTTVTSGTRLGDDKSRTDGPAKSAPMFHLETPISQTPVQILTTEMAEIPRSEKAREKDNKMGKIKEFLRKPEDKLGLESQDLKKFIRMAQEYFLLNNQLWKKEKHGKHKLVIFGEKRYQLIRQAHNKLGHKGIFTVWMFLLE
jgi:hypothetical protein